MLFTILDFESKDPYIGLDLGAGWAFGINCSYANLFYPIGYSYCIYNSETGDLSKSTYYPLSTKSLHESMTHPNMALLKDLIKTTKNIVCHNAQYDLGCLLALGIPINHLRTYDTMVMAKLNDSSLWSYSLSSLLTKYQLSEKMTGSLLDIVKDFDLLKSRKGNTVKRDTSTYEKRAKDFAYANMDLLQEKDFDRMAYYANHDTYGTALLFKYLYPKVGDSLAHFYSNIQKICTKIRAKGIIVSMENVDRAIDILSPALVQVEQDLYRMFKSEFNLRSKEQLAEHMLNLNYKLSTTEAGNYSVNKEFLEENPNDPVCQAISKFRTLDILLNNFVIKTKNMQQYSCPDVQAGSMRGLVFPEMNLLEARTGRFSSSNPNIQNIPKRNKEFASLCRAMFVPSNPEHEWYSLDWSNQEGRLQLHYAFLKRFKGSVDWRKRFLENPTIDTHSLVAEMMGGVPRDTAKTIYLGKSFCMGRAKTALRLGLPVELKPDFRGNLQETSGPEATELIEKYEKAFPYLSELQKDCRDVIKEKGYITTLGGRRCKRPPMLKGRNFDYKAISLLIQGSAADQMYKALTQADEAGVDIKCIVHDEFNIEGTEKDALLMKEIMENCVKLEVPSVAEINVGKNWGELRKYKNDTKSTS